MGFLGDFLGGIGDILATPKNLLYQHVLSPLAGRDVKSFGDLMGNDENTGFAGHALGFLGDMLTDPLTYAGGFAARGLRGAMFGRTAGLGAAGGDATGLATNAALKGSAESAPVIWGAKLGESAAAPGLSAGEGSALRLASNPSVAGNALTGEVTGGTAAIGPRALTAKADKVRDVMEATPGSESLLGSFHPDSRTIVSPLERPALTDAGLLPEGTEQALQMRRHERFHALVDSAMNNPQAAGDMPFLARQAASLRSSQSPMARSLGGIADEVGAHAAESRNLMGQLQNAGHFLFDPQTNAAYRNQIALAGGQPGSPLGSPLVASLYGMLPSTFPAAGAATGYGLSSLGR